MWKPALVLFPLGLSSCASVASGPYGTPLDTAGKPSAAEAQAAKLKVSAREIPEMSSRYFGEIEFTLENPTAEWVRVDKVALDFGGPKINQSVYFPWGSQLDNWLEATRQRNAVQEENVAMTLAVLGLGAGMVAGAAGGPGSGVRMAGGLVSMAALAGAAAVATSESSASTPPTEGPVFFGRHLFAFPIEVPPGLFVKRFVVVNTPDDPGLGCLSRLVIRYDLADKTTHLVAVDFRTGDASRGRSLWQSNVCPHGEW